VVVSGWFERGLFLALCFLYGFVSDLGMVSGVDWRCLLGTLGWGMVCGLL
jgi:hypothetical protein